MQPLRRHMHLSLMPWVVQTPALSFSSCLLLQSSQMMSLVEMMDQSLVGQSRKGRNKGLRYGKGFLASQLVESWFRSGVLAEELLEAFCRPAHVCTVAGLSKTNLGDAQDWCWPFRRFFDTSVSCIFCWSDFVSTLPHCVITEISLLQGLLNVLWFVMVESKCDELKHGHVVVSGLWSVAETLRVESKGWWHFCPYQVVVFGRASLFPHVETPPFCGHLGWS